jgi:hypothetical protein
MKHLDEFVKVKIPIKWLVVLWHFWNDQSAREAFFSRYVQFSAGYREKARDMMTYYQEFSSVHKVLESVNINPLDLNEFTVKLNEEYSAEITSDGIKVGCTTFPFDTFDKLKEAVKDFKKSKKT